ncbi:MAG: 50S ribosomal protein L29 [Bacteroidales bacterium]|jgi:large subunit ribosomal protein L29|nr:50S ribosomal protein L29 [Bacteroidales bacterium]
MKQQVIRELSTNDLLERLEEEKKQFTRVKLNHAVSPLENPHTITEARHSIARIHTELRKRELDENNKQK